MDKFLDTFGDRFSDGCELIARGFRAASNLLTLALGYTGLGLFAVIVSPIAALGYVARRCGFKSRWWPKTN